ncbi:hypothetical protein NIES2107_00480 [Nostoc carneum NIES-2107]|nr:hypothetical protein NIES2107_00480 [Nostoc carneum NIES-2107]
MMVYQFGRDGEETRGKPMNSDEHNSQLKIYFRLVDVLALITGWSLAFLTGLLLWFAPTEKDVDRVAWFFGLLKHEWGKLHLFMGVIALCITTIHLVISQKVLQSLNHRHNLWE